MRRSLLLLSITFSITLNAQSWCPPGAEWHWTIFALGVDGYVHRWYDGDTIIGGRNAQMVKEDGIMINYFSQDTVMLNDTVLTSVDGSDVLLWVQYDGLWQWDTLYRFGALPGTVWRPASLYGEAYCTVEVTDTATVLVDGVPLRQLMLTYLDENNDPFGWGPTITERLGGEWGMWDLGIQCMLDAGVEWIRCYTDLDIEYIDPGWSFGCASSLDLPDPSLDVFQIHPNPGTDHFTVQLRPGLHQLTLIDAQGRSVLRQQLSEEHLMIHTATHPSGIYHIQITDSRGGSTSQRWIKE